jgi:RNA polymerase sigma factor
MNEPAPLPAGQIAEAKTSKEAMGRLVSAYMPFIKTSVSGVFFKKELQEEYVTEAMLAFLQSVRTYQSESGAFIPYARTVIRNRLLNAAAKEGRIRKWHIPFFSKKAASNGESAAGHSPPEIEIARRGYEAAVEQENLRLEIAEINAEFSGWDFDVTDLARRRPKQDRSRLTCQAIAQAALARPGLIAEIKETRKLPVKKISALTGCSEKTLEKYRRYIVALILIMSGGYPYIQSFLPGMKDFSGQEETA